MNVFYSAHINLCNFHFRCRLRNSRCIVATQKAIQIFLSCSKARHNKFQRSKINYCLLFLSNQHISIQCRKHSIPDGACDYHGIFVFETSLLNIIFKLRYTTRHGGVLNCIAHIQQSCYQCIHVLTN